MIYWGSDESLEIVSAEALSFVGERSKWSNLAAVFLYLLSSDLIFQCFS